MAQVIARWLGALLLCCGSVSAEKAQPAQGAEDWVHHYYQQPAPEQFVLQVRALSESGALTDEPQRIPLQVFLGAVIEQHPVDFTGWMTALSDLPEASQESLALAVWRADTPEAKDWLAALGSESDDVGPPRIEGSLVRTGLQLKMLWYRFYATGNEALVHQVVALLEPPRGAQLDPLAAEQALSAEQSEALYQQLHNLALWSLEQHIAEHPQVLEMIGQMYLSGELSVRQQAVLVPLLVAQAPGQFVAVDDVAVPQ